MPRYPPISGHACVLAPAWDSHGNYSTTPDSGRCPAQPRAAGRDRTSAAGWLQRSLEVPEDVVDRLDPHRDADHVLGHAAGGQRLVVQPAVGGGGGVDHERLGVADVRQVRAELAGLDEALARL